LGPIPNPQSPIPNPQSPIKRIISKFINNTKIYLKIIIYISFFNKIIYNYLIKRK